MMTRFEHAIVDPIGVVVSPVVGIVSTPVLLLGALFKTVEAWFHGRNVADEMRSRDICKYDANLDGRDISWLKSERSRLQAADTVDECLAMAKKTAKLLIPIFGYISVFYRDDWGLRTTHSDKISWLTWHINLLEGRMSKDSWFYKLGLNLPDSHVY